MKRILIFGNSGAGKSTLAKSLAVKFSCDHLDLDILAWQDTQPPTRRPLCQSLQDIDSFIRNHENWVIEGGYSDLLGYVVKQANEIIFINQGVDKCIEHCKKRPWEEHKYSSKEAQDNNLAMLIEWVNDYYIREDEFSFASHKMLFEKFNGDKREITHSDEIK